MKNSYINHLANKVVDNVFDIAENEMATMSEIVVGACESIKDKINIIKNNRADFFTEMWEIAENSDMNEKESNCLSAVEGAIVMMCGGEI